MNNNLVQELCGLKAQEITNQIMDQNGSNAFQKSEASENAYKSAVASYSATLSTNESVTKDLEEASVSAFTSSVTATSLASVTSTLIQNTIVSNTSLLLLQPNIYNSDLNIEKTFNYYWDKYPDLFGRIQIVYTDVDENGNIITDNVKIIENNIKYLNEYYNKGYTLFIGFDISNILAGVLPWFENIGVKAKGISITSTADSLNFPKPVYRLEVDKVKILKNILNNTLNDASKIYYVYSEGGFTPLDILIYLEEIYPDKLITFSVKPDSSNLTLSNIEEFYKDVDEKSVTLQILYVNTQQSDFLNVFNDSYPMPTLTYDIVLNIPEINESSKNAVVNKYNLLNDISFSTSLLFREGLDNQKYNFFPNVPNTLLLINKLAVNGDVTTLPSHNSILQFDENNDIKYYTFLDIVYSKNDKGEYYYKQNFYAVYDPIVGRQTFYVNQL